MSLNNISLPLQLLADLYQNVLVQDTATAMPVKEPIPFLGKNGKNILILVNKKDSPYLPDKELSFLTTVLSACGLDLSHVSIVNWTKLREKNASNVLEQLSPKQVLLLDVEPSSLGFVSGELFSVQKQGNIQFVEAPSLSEIEKTKQAKSQLWVALKQLFCL
jgi:DNA polymerase III psi subunit